MSETPSLDNYFVPEVVEDIWNVSVGQRLPLHRFNKIGWGGFGETYDVMGWLGKGIPSFPVGSQDESAKPEQHCCLKLLKKVDADEDEDEYRARMRLEYDILLEAAGAHGRVPRPLGRGVATLNGFTYQAVVMEYLPNGNGTYFLNDSNMANDTNKCMPGEASPLQVATFAYQFALALRDLHACKGGVGITHRDLQPANVAVRLGRNFGQQPYPSIPEGASIIKRVYLIDLGNSTSIDRMVTPGLNGTHAPHLATYQFGAPEVFDLYADGTMGSLWPYRNKPTVDIWSFGALVYLYLTGRNPDRFDQYQASARERGTLPKKGGLTVTREQLARFNGDPLATELADIIRTCTIYEPEERARKARLEDIVTRLGVALALVTPPPPDVDKDKDKGGVEELPPELPTRQETAGPFTFQLLDAYRLDSSEDNRRSYVRTDEYGCRYRFVSSWEKDAIATRSKAEYANALAERIDNLFLHTGKAHGDEALTVLGTSGAVLRRGRGRFRPFCIVEFAIPQTDGESFVMQVRLYFLATFAIRLGLGCRCSQEMEQNARRIVDEEMNRLSESIDLADNPQETSSDAARLAYDETSNLSETVNYVS